MTKSNDIFDPKQVQFKLDIVGESVTCVPMLYDIQNHEAIITNIGVGGKDWNHVANTKPHFDLPKGCERIENYASSLAMTLFAYENLNKPSIYELAELYVNHKEATVVDDPSLADIIFAIDRIDVEDGREVVAGIENPKQIIISPFDKDVITAELIPAPLTKDQVKEIDQKLESQELMGLLESYEIGFERE